MLKVSFGQLKPTCDTRIIHFYYYNYARATLAWMKKKPKNVHLEMINLKQTELQILEQRKEWLRIRPEKDRARRRTKNTRGKEKSSETEDHEKQIEH